MLGDADLGRGVSEGVTFTPQHWVVHRQGLSLAARVSHDLNHTDGHPPGLQEVPTPNPQVGVAVGGAGSQQPPPTHAVDNPLAVRIEVQLYTVDRKVKELNQRHEFRRRRILDVTWQRPEYTADDLHETVRFQDTLYNPPP